MSAFIVACPGCGTQFRVTEAHLAPARGLVMHEVFYPPEWRLPGDPEKPSP